MKKIIMLLLFLCMGAHATTYKTLQSHGAILCTFLNDYVVNNNTQNSADVLNYLNSSATGTIFSDALVSGYTRDKLLFEAYQQSFSMVSPQQSIIDGLRDAVAAAKKQETIINDVVRYSMFATMGAFSIMTLGLGRFFWVYFRTDRKILHHYKQNAHRYVTGNILSVNTNSIATNASTSTETNPLVPEPFFQ